MSIPSLDKDSDSLIRETMKNTNVNGKSPDVSDQQEHMYFVPETIDDIDVDRQLVEQAR